jgi:hypothetical protein
METTRNQTHQKKKKKSKTKRMNGDYLENQDRLEKQVKKLQDRLKDDTTCVSRKYVEYLSSLVMPGQTSVQPFMTREVSLDVIPLPLSNGFSLDKVLGIDGSGQQTPNTDIGKFAYTCLFYGPLLTSISDGAKISGFNAFSTSDPNLSLSCDHITGLDSSGAPTAQSFTQSTIYGSDMSDIGTHGTCFTGTICMEPVIPSANLAGQYFKGYLTIGQLIQEDGTYNAFTVQQLINQSSLIEHTAGQPIVLHSHVRDPSNIPFKQQDKGGKMVGPVMGEVIEYVILQNLGRNITTGENSLFSLVCSVASNWAVWPRTTPASRSLTKCLSHKNHDEIEVPSRQLVEVEQKLHQPEITTTTPNGTWEEVKRYGKKALKWLGDQLVEHSSDLIPLAMSMLLEPLPYRIIDVTDMKFRLSLIQKMSLKGDPELDDLISNFNTSLEGLRNFCKEKTKYIYPPIIWARPEDIAVPGDSLSTWSRIDASCTPSLSPCPFNVFKLDDSSRSAKVWYKDFMILFTSRKSALNDGLSRDSSFPRSSGDSSFVKKY